MDLCGTENKNLLTPQISYLRFLRIDPCLKKPADGPWQLKQMRYVHTLRLINLFNVFHTVNKGPCVS